LTELTLDPPSATSDEAGASLVDEDYLVLSTIHSAKGQEWKSVFVLNCVDGCIPSDLATGSTPEIEEERRLLYVAMTRAEDYLHMIVPQRFFVYQQRGSGDRHMYAQRTRFIPDAMLDHFERCAWPPAAHESSSRATSPPNPVDLGARLKQMWRWPRLLIFVRVIGPGGSRIRRWSPRRGVHLALALFARLEALNRRIPTPPQCQIDPL